MYYNGRVINVILLENACGVPGSVWHNSDDSYTIFIDASLSSSHQKKVNRISDYIIGLGFLGKEKERNGK